MPGFDRTGPAGQGSGTGRKFGKCYPENESQTGETTTGRRPGRGLRLGLGRRLGMGWNFQEQEKGAAGMGRRFGRRRGRRN